MGAARVVRVRPPIPFTRACAHMAFASGTIRVPCLPYRVLQKIWRGAQAQQTVPRAQVRQCVACAVAVLRAYTPRRSFVGRFGKK